MDQVRGKIKNYVFHNDENSYSIARLITEDQKTVTIVGYFPVVSEDMTYEFSGTWVKHSTYGEQLKVESSLLDFDDLLTYTYYYLTSNNNNLSLSKYSWIQVDEVQDLNPIQWEIIKLVAETDAHILFFGDYEQAIFSFMGAKLERLHTIEKECRIHNLQKNFRSPSYLLQIYIDYAKTHLSPKWKKDPVPNKIEIPNQDDLLLIKVNGENINEANYITHLTQRRRKSLNF